MILTTSGGVCAHAYPYIVGVTMATSVIALVAAVIHKETKNLNVEDVL